MAMVVKNNMSAVRTLNTLNQNSNALSKSLSRVSSGMKINSAQDDAAGYAISERMRVRIRSLDQANQNTQNDSSLMKTAEGAVANTVELLRALKEKAINAANDSNTDEDRQTIQKELNQFIDQIDDNALVQFNGKYLVDGSKNNAAVSTKTILLNQSLEAGTKAGSALTTYNNRAGDSLGILTTDKWQVSWVKNGTIHTASGDVGNKTLENILETIVGVDGQVAATSTAGLIGTVEESTDPMYGYTAVDTAVKTTTGINGTALMAMFSDATNKGILTTTNDGFAGAEGATLALSDYYYSDSANDGAPTAETITITKHVNASTSAVTYDVSSSSANAHSIYEKSGSSPTNVPPLTAEPTAVTLTGGTGVDAPNNVVVSQIKSGSTLGDFGYYTLKETDADGVNTYEKSTIGISVNSGDNTKVDFTVPTGTTLYEFDKTDSELITKGCGFVDYPSTIVGKEADKAVSDKFNKSVYTPDKTEGIAFVANNAGVKEQISGLTISIMDQDGNVKKAANAALDQFKQYQRAENETGDMSLNFHIGSEANVAIKVGLGDMRSQALGLKGSNGERILVTTKENANASINVIENALTKALDQQTTIGAIEARLEYTATNLTTSSENVQAAESTIRDADMAKEMTNYTKNNVLLQAAQAMLAQANQNSSAVLSLLQ